MIGGEGEANRKHFPVNCLLWCSHVNTCTRTHTHTAAHTYAGLLQLSHVTLCCSHTFIYIYNRGNARVHFICSFLYTYNVSQGFPMSTHASEALTHTQTHLPGALIQPECQHFPRRMEADQNRTGPE